MKTTYLNAEIETLNLLERNGDLSEYGKDKLAEFKAIKQALALFEVGITFKGKEEMTFDEWKTPFISFTKPDLFVYKGIKYSEYELNSVYKRDVLHQP